MRCRAALPLLAIIVVAAIYGLFDAGNGFGQFLFHGLFLAVLAPFALGLGVTVLIAAVRRRDSAARPWFLAVVAAAALIPNAGVLMTWPRDRLWLAVWSLRHGEALRRPGVLVMWEAWGLAGMENASWLVSDPMDMLTIEIAAQRWGGKDCDVVALRRLWRGAFIVTTMNCDLPLEAAP